jgi:glutathione S-transferase
MTTSELILHHYDESPFSEKIRLILGFKKLGWKSVTIPSIMPKPDVIALTGGYRRTPFLQIGADVYCDTALMSRVIDAVAPEPPLYPAEATGLYHLVAQWADSALFWAAVPYTLQPANVMHAFRDVTPEQIKAFADDRAAMTTGMRRATPIDGTAQLTTYLSWLESMLEAGHEFLLGARPCIADFSVAHSIWFVRRVPAPLLAPFPRLVAWHARIVALGHGVCEPLSGEAAIAIAAGASGHAAARVEPDLGFEAGAAITVAANDYGTDLVAGTLVGLTADEVVLERRDDRAGTVHVHFPRIGYQIRKAR